MLSSRVALNIYLWVVLAYIVLDMNYNNEQAHKYGIIQSPWYSWFILCGFVLQMTLVYVNNFYLAPKFIARKKYGKYFFFAFLLVFTISVIYTLGVKTAATHFNVNHVQQVGLVSSPVTKSWSLRDILDDTTTYLIGNAMWVFIFTLAWYMHQYRKQQKILDEIHIKQREAELFFLKNQINPHFLFNTLNNLYGLALRKSDNAPDAILRLSSILRYLLYDSDVKFVSFEKEKETMQAYIGLELLRLPADNNFNFEIDADRNYSIPPLLWLPILENVFKHATRIITTDYYINYKFTIRDNQLAIYAKNNYKSSGVDKGPGGIGLQNLRKRLDLLYPGSYTLEASADELYYTIQLKIQLACA